MQRELNSKAIRNVRRKLKRDYEGKLSKRDRKIVQAYSRECRLFALVASLTDVQGST